MSAYGTLGTLFYDADKPRAGEAEVAWYAARLPREAGPVLEAMAGSGRVLLPPLRTRLGGDGGGRSEGGAAPLRARVAGCGRAAHPFLPQGTPPQPAARPPPPFNPPRP